MDGWMIFAFIEGIIIILLMSLSIHIMIVIAREARNREEIRETLHSLHRLQIQAEVTQVSFLGRIRYDIHAKWYSFETGKTYYFYDNYWYLRGILGFRPKIDEGDAISVDVAFRPFIYLINRSW